VVTLALAIDITVGFIAAIMFAYVSSRCIVISSILAALFILVSTIALPAVAGELTTIEIVSTCIFAAAFIIYGALMARSGGKTELGPRLPSVFLAVLTVIVFYIAWYGLSYLHFPTYVTFSEKMLYITYMAIAFALVFAAFLFKDAAKMGLTLMMTIWCLHTFIPETYAMMGVGVELFCLTAIGAMVYYAYREYGTRDIDVMTKLRF